LGLLPEVTGSNFLQILGEAELALEKENGDRQIMLAIREESG